jgi:1,2-phenylacetyl-CoA epoxidase PaaB subunit
VTDSRPADPLADVNATDGRTLEAWEVFRQEKDGDPMRHGGSVMAPDATLALHYAR